MVIEEDKLKNQPSATTTFASTGGFNHVLYPSGTGVKYGEGKTVYEFDWEFIEAMAKRMSRNKSKYPPYNWKKPIDIEELKQANMRHNMEIMKGNYTDEGVELDHLVALSLNAMMLYFQIKNQSI